MVHQQLDMEAVLVRANDYFDSQRTRVTPNTFASRIGITPKQARYVLFTYFDSYKRKHSHIFFKKYLFRKKY